MLNTPAQIATGRKLLARFGSWDAVRQAYRRGQAMEKRRALMAAWSDYCLGKRGTVVSLRG